MRRICSKPSLSLASCFLTAEAALCYCIVPSFPSKFLLPEVSAGFKVVAPGEAAIIPGIMTESINSSAKLTKKTLDELDLTKHRLAKLQLDEQRLQAQIALATHRSQSLEARRQRTHELTEERKAHREEIQKHQEEIRSLVSSSRKKRQEAMEAAKQRLLAQRKSVVEEVQRERKINECSFHIVIEEERARVLSRRKEIRDLEQAVKEKRERAAHNRLSAVKAQLQQEIQYDQKERSEKEKEAQRLKQYEAELRNKVLELKQQKDATNRHLNELFGVSPDEGQRSGSEQQSPRSDRQESASASSARQGRSSSTS